VKRSGLAFATVLFGMALAVPSVARHELTIGNSNVVVKTVTGEIGAEKRQLQLNDDVYFNEAITTEQESATEITFLDGTKLTLGEQTEVILDKFVYDPDPSNSQFVLSVSKGVMRFVSGSMPSEAYTIHTPVGTVGIRGSAFTAVCLDPPDCTVWEVVNKDGEIAYTCEGEVADINAPNLAARCRQGETPSEVGPASPEALAAEQAMDTTVLSGLEPGAGPGTQGEGPPPANARETQDNLGRRGENAAQDTDDQDAASFTGSESGG